MRSLIRSLTHSGLGAIAAIMVLGGGAAAVATDGFGHLDPAPAIERSVLVPVVETDDSGADSPQDLVDDKGGERDRAVDDSPNPSPPASPAPSTTPGPGSNSIPGTSGGPVVAAATYQVAEAGTVTISSDGRVLTVIAVSPAGDWAPEVERGTGIEVEVSFRSAGARVDFNAQIDDGAIRARVRDRRTDTRVEVAPNSNGGTQTSPAPVTPSPDASPEPSSTPSPNPTSGPSPEPTTQQTAPQTLTIPSTGGSVTVVVSANTVTFVGASPNAGYRADVRKAGPDKVEVRFENDAADAESRIEIEVANGEVRQRVEDR